MICPVCGADNETGAAFCYRCGSSLKGTPGATGATVNLGRASAAPDAETGARVYDAPPQPAPVRDFASRGADVPPGMSETELTGPGYTVPAQPMAAYTVPAGVGTIPEQSNSALISMILGITSLVLFMLLLCVFFLSPLSAVAGIPAVILGRNARREIRASGGRLTGENMAVAGIIMGWINIGLSVLMLCAIIAFFGALAAGLSAS